MLYKKNSILLRQANQERHRQGGPQLIMAITIIGEAHISVSWGSSVVFDELHYCRDALLCIRHYKYIYFRGRLRRLLTGSLNR